MKLGMETEQVIARFDAAKPSAKCLDLTSEER
jgi:hypothetical protein